jgi:hypothetical protein
MTNAAAATAKPRPPKNTSHHDHRGHYTTWRSRPGPRAKRRQTVEKPPQTRAQVAALACRDCRSEGCRPAQIQLVRWSGGAWMLEADFGGIPPAPRPDHQWQISPTWHLGTFYRRPAVHDVARGAGALLPR